MPYDTGMHCCKMQCLPPLACFAKVLVPHHVLSLQDGLSRLCDVCAMVIAVHLGVLAVLAQNRICAFAVGCATVCAGLFRSKLATQSLSCRTVAIASAIA